MIPATTEPTVLGGLVSVVASAVVRCTLLALLACASCGSDAGIGVQIISVEPDPVTLGLEVEVFISRDCFFAVSLQDVLRASGRRDKGTYRIPVDPQYLRLGSNELRIDVAGYDGSASADVATFEYCAQQGEPGCGEMPDAGPHPDAGSEPDGGVVRDDVLCRYCLADDDCEGLPNECVRWYYTDDWGICGTDCSSGAACPQGYQCTYFHDSWHESYLCYPEPPGYECP